MFYLVCLFGTSDILLQHSLTVWDLFSDRLPPWLPMRVYTVICDDQNYRSRHFRAIGNVQRWLSWVIMMDIAGPLEVIRGVGPLLINDHGWHIVSSAFGPQQATIWHDKIPSTNPTLDTTISIRSFGCLSITLRPTLLDSVKGWTGDFWLKWVFPLLEN